MADSNLTPQQQQYYADYLDALIEIGDHLTTVDDNSEDATKTIKSMAECYSEHFKVERTDDQAFRYRLMLNNDACEVHRKFMLNLYAADTLMRRKAEIFQLFRSWDLMDSLIKKLGVASAAVSAMVQPRPDDVYADEMCYINEQRFEAEQLRRSIDGVIKQSEEALAVAVNDAVMGRGRCFSARTESELAQSVDCVLETLDRLEDVDVRIATECSYHGAYSVDLGDLPEKVNGMMAKNAYLNRSIPFYQLCNVLNGKKEGMKNESDTN